MSEIARQLAALSPGEQRALLAELLREKAPKAKLALPSFAQERLWFLDQLELGSSFYIMSVAVRLAGQLDAATLKQSLNEIVRRHETLRTTFVAQEGKPIQVIVPSLQLPLPLTDLGDLPEAMREVEAQRLAGEEARQPFDLAKGPLFRASLARLNEREHILLLTFHHIVSDGWSTNILIRELATLYPAFLVKRPSPLPELPIQYADYAAWQREWQQGQVLEAQLLYWKQRLDSASTAFELPTDRVRPPAQTFRGAREWLRLGKPLSRALKALSRQEGVTLFTTLLAAFKVLLHRYTGQVDIIVGTPVANRNRAEVEELIGLFLNTLVLRTDLAGNPTFRVLLGRVRETVLEAHAHQEMPFEKLVEALEPERDLSRTPLFQVFFNMLSFGPTTIELEGLTVNLLSPPDIGSKFDLTLYVRNQGEDLRLDLVYNADLFEQDTARWLIGRLQTLLAGIVAHPDSRLSQLPLLTEAERRHLSRQRNLIHPTQPFVEFERDEVEQSIPDRFERQALKYSERIAVKTEQRVLTYSQLSAAARRVARVILAQCGGRPGRIALLLEHNAPMIAGILGVLKAGKTYVPFDPHSPQERLTYLLQDAQVEALLADQKNLALAQGLAQDRLPLIDMDDAEPDSASGNICPTVWPDTVAYLLYTSGSTGRPKGVVQNHRNVLQHIRNYTNNLHINSEDRLTLLSSYGFDAAVMDILGAVLNGAMLCPIDLREEGMEGLAEWLVQQEITIYHSTPTVYRHLMSSLKEGERLEQVRLVVMGGEPVCRRDVDLYKKHFVPGCIFMNGLGPTESTVSLQYLLNHGTEVRRNAIPVGYPVEGMEVALLDEAGAESELYGEIALQSRYVALGYWNRPESSQQTFRADPAGGDKRIYRTGDMGRLLPDGSLEFVGRRDHQVKIRGYRVELGEIEARLAEYAAVQEAVVVAREAGSDCEAGLLDRRLVAYIVPRPGLALDVGVLRRFLREQLPDYMLPSAFVSMESLPLMPNGKVDRRALPAPEPGQPDLEQAFVAPRTPVEEMLAGIWAEVLGLERVSIYANFFELGGHSLLATQIVSRVRDVLQVALPLRKIFEAPTVAGLAESVTIARHKKQPQQVSPILPAPRDEELPLSFAQESALKRLDQWGRDRYNMSAAIHIRGPLDIPALEPTLNEIVRRHQVLRTTFAVMNGRPVQRVEPELILIVPVVDLQELPVVRREAQARQWATEDVQRTFDLTHGPLLRVTLWKLCEQDYILSFAIHHIASDGWSLGLLFREASILYEASSDRRPLLLPKLPIQYADYAYWQRHLLQGEYRAELLSYWVRQLRGCSLRLNWPAHRPRPAIPTFQGATQPLAISPALTGTLRVLSRREGTTLFMTMLAAFKVLLYFCTGQTDLVVGTHIANRNRTEIEGLIGFFAHDLLLRTDLSGDPTFLELLHRVRNVTVEAYTHQDMHLMEIREAVPFDSPYFSVKFALQDTPAGRLNRPIPGLSFNLLKVEINRLTTHDISMYLWEEADGLSGMALYSTDLFDVEAVTWMLRDFQALLETIVDNPQQRLSALRRALSVRSCG